MDVAWRMDPPREVIGCVLTTFRDAAELHRLRTSEEGRGARIGHASNLQRRPQSLLVDEIFTGAFGRE